MLNDQMIESMDIAFLFVGIPSTHDLFSVVMQLIPSIINPLKEHNYDIRLALIKFRSVNNSLVPVAHMFTRSMITFISWLLAGIASAERCRQDGTTVIGDALREVRNLNWRSTNRDQCHENLVILITSGLPCRLLADPTENPYNDDPCACDDLWIISNQFVKRNLILVIVGVGEIVSVCDSLYGAVAKNTGGEYIPLTNATRVLFLGIQAMINQGYTLSQSFRHIKQEEFEKNSSFRHSNVQKRDESDVKHCQTMAQKGAWLLNNYN